MTNMVRDTNITKYNTDSVRKTVRSGDMKFDNDDWAKGISPSPL